MRLHKIIFSLISSALIVIPCFAAEMPPAVVTTMKVSHSSFQPSIQETGSLSAMQGINVRPEVNGRITKIFFKSGQLVKKGDSLFQINPDIYKAELIQNQANLKLSKLNYQRALKLYKQHAVSEADLDKAEATMRADEGAVMETQAKLDQTLTKAPFAGRVGLRQVSLGDYVTAGQNIANLQALNPIRVEFSIPEVYLGKIRIGAKVKVNIDAYPNEEFIGKVYAFDSQVDQDTRSLAIRATVPNEKQKLLPGTFAQVTLYFAEPQTVIRVPQTALVYTNKAYYVYTVINGHAKKIPVTIAYQDAEEAVISKGLKTGDVVVTAGQIKLYDGAKVMTRQ